MTKASRPAKCRRSGPSRSKGLALYASRRDEAAIIVSSSQLSLSLLLLLNIIPGIAYEDPLPECDFCLPDAVPHAPGVGLELTTSYA
jgi:hypothetical protein